MLTQLYCPLVEGGVLHDVTMHAVAWTNRDVHIGHIVGESLASERKLNSNISSVSHAVEPWPGSSVCLILVPHLPKMMDKTTPLEILRGGNEICL